MISRAQAVARGLFISLGLCQTDFKEFCSESHTVSLMRFFHYLSFQQSDNKIGSSPHTDWGFLTLILQQQGVLGLQYSPEKDVWIDVEPKPGTLLVNCGDYLSLLSGSLVSPLHRVTAPSTLNDLAKCDRYSMVLFYYPNFRAKIPSNTSVKQQYSLFQDQKTKQPKDKDSHICFGDYVLQKWNQVYR